MHLIKVVVDLAAVDALGEQGPECVPRNLLGRQVGAAHGDRVDPHVDRVAGAAQVRLVELVLLGPAERRVREAFLHDGVEPREQEVQARALVWSLSTRWQHSCTFPLPKNSKLRTILFKSVSKKKRIRNGKIAFKCESNRPLFLSVDNFSEAKEVRGQLTLHILAAGTVLNVRTRFALTPGGGSNTKMRPALNRFTGNCR